MGGVLRMLRNALLGGATLTGLLCATAIYRGNVDGAALYGLLFVCCVLMLRLKPANQRPHA